MKKNSFSTFYLFVFFLAIFSQFKAYAGPSISLVCNDTVEGDRFTAFDLDPKNRLLSFSGKHHMLPGEQNIFFPADDFAYKFQSHVLAYSEKAVEIEAVSEEGESPEIYLSGQESSLGKLDKMILINHDPIVMADFEQRKGGAILVFANKAQTSLEFKKCYFEGGNVQDWQKMWNPFPL